MEKVTLADNPRQAEQFKISNVMVVRPPERGNVDISDLMAKVKKADRGNRSALYDLYDNLLALDAVLGDAVDKRIRAITNANITFQIDSKDVEVIDDLIDSSNFEELLRQIMMTMIVGKTVLEFDFSGGFNFTTIKRQHINTAQKVIVRHIGDTTGISYENDDFLLNLGNDNDLGILLRVAPYAIYKRNGWGDYAAFCERFGIPILAGLYDPEDENGRAEMEAAFELGGGNASVVMSKNSEIKTIGAETAGNHAIHDTFTDKCDEQILIGILSQTMTTKDGSSLAQGKVHADTEDDLNTSDRRYVQRVLNNLVLPMLEKRGYPVNGGWFHFVDKGKELSLAEELEIALKVDAKAPIAQDWWYEKFGFPKPQESERKARVKKAEKESDQENPDKEEEKTDKKVKASISYWNNLIDFFAGAPR